MYDLIGDIHGHADELVQLLENLGYEFRQGIYRHPERKVIFLGDFIDRGPQIRRVLEIVHAMVESGSALSVMGNHELNALAYHTEDLESPGDFLRRHSPSNDHQISQTLRQLTTDEVEFYLNWFRKLPIWLDLDGLRVVHACWDDRAIDKITQALGSRHELTCELLQSACRPGKELFDAVEVLLKGKEASLPEGIVLLDKDGHIRKKTRVRWYSSPQGQTFRNYTLTDTIDSDLAIESSLIESVNPYPSHAKPVFIGHYWMSSDRPQILAENVACLDYSVARGGFLCSYRWNGEHKLSNDHFVWFKSV